MSEYIPAGSPGYRRLGLIANPFEPSIEALDPIRTLAGHAAAMQILAAIDAAASEGDGRPVWIEKDEDLTPGVGRYSIGDMLASTNDNPGVPVLLAYLPLELMRQGRTRSALFVLSDRLCSPSLPKTLGAYVAHILQADVDTELPEATSLDPNVLAELVADVAADPSDVAGRIFGEYVETRDDPHTTDLIIRESEGRREPESWDEEEPPTAVEEAEGMVAPEACSDVDEAATDVEVDLVEPHVAVRRYVIAYTRAHLSPVLARALVAYADHGLWAFSQELKVTKAPRKTLAALCRFAAYRFRAVVLLYDRFGAWPTFDFDMRQKILASLSSIRWASRPSGIVAVAGIASEMPELQEQFGLARRARWGFSALEELQAGEIEPTFAALIEAARLPGSDLDPRVSSSVDAALDMHPGGTLEDLRQAAALAVRALASN